ncbi:DAZ-associated protein 2 isoform X2 [Megalobrama amblycephala]|uniref:DAZ-associated protein 2 isoform X2 n=1 Tax=Megalobrama amblycephala TaxID=75352 RepID=UPI002013D179|nr:DAZ-associated protein 2 isoform X2 [Megalobrama amblycephala]
MNNKGSYPQQAVYPQQSTAPVYPPAMQVPPQVSPYPDAPPPYSEVYQPRYMAPPPAHGQMPQMTSAYPGTQMYMPMHAQTVPMGAMAPSVPMAYYQMGPVYPPGSTVMMEGGFDAGARFGPGTSASIPTVGLTEGYKQNSYCKGMFITENCIILCLLFKQWQQLSCLYETVFCFKRLGGTDRMAVSFSFPLHLA